MDKEEFKRIIRELRRKHNLATDKQIDREVDKSLSQFSTSVGEIVDNWNGKKLKNVGKHNAHHYRRKGILYIAVRDKAGVINIVENSTSKTTYAGIENTLRLTSAQTKNSNHALNNRLEADFLTYQAKMIREANKV